MVRVRQATFPTNLERLNFLSKFTKMLDLPRLAATWIRSLIRCLESSTLVLKISDRSPTDQRICCRKYWANSSELKQQDHDPVSAVKPMFALGET